MNCVTLPELPFTKDIIVNYCYREVEFSSTSFSRGSGHRQVDVLEDLKKYPIKPYFGGLFLFKVLR